MTLADPNTPIDGDANAADGNVIELPSCLAVDSGGAPRSV